MFVIGIAAGYFTDSFNFQHKFLSKFQENKLPLHAEPQCKCFQRDKIRDYLLSPSLYRLILAIIILLLVLGVAAGILAGEARIWMKFTILLSLVFSFFVVVTVPDHFLKEHIWDHIVKMHIPRIFLWTFGTLVAIHFLMNYIDIQSWLSDNMLVVLLLAVLIGIIPESGPHLIFVTLFFQGAIPFSVLMASSISQDGHGTLPLLAESKRGFLAVKLVNIAYALVFGLIGYFAGF